MRLIDEKESRDFLETYVITREVLYQEASKRGYDKNSDIVAKVEDYKRAIVIDALLEEGGLYKEIYDLQLRDQERFRREMLYLHGEAELPPPEVEGSVTDGVPERAATGAEAGARIVVLVNGVRPYTRFVIA
jgi:hypothetical protein